MIDFRSSSLGLNDWKFLGMEVSTVLSLRLKVGIVWNIGDEFTRLTSVNNCQIYFDVRNATNIKLNFAWVSSALLGFI
jgi:hypothetical protein